jgi:hypothetical protein
MAVSVKLKRLALEAQERVRDRLGCDGEVKVLRFIDHLHWQAAFSCLSRGVFVRV